MELTTEQQEYLQKKHEVLVDAVRRMRGHQREYFKYHSSQDLNAAKQWERKVDALLKEEVDQQKQQQKSLF
jgi:hypothetical protein